MSIKQHSNIIYLTIIIFSTLLIYKISGISKDVLGIIVSPLLTLCVLSIIEERKSKWNAKYEAFKTLYANRGDILNDKTINCLNSIDILFIDDKKVRDCWNKLYQYFNKASEIATLILGATNEAQLEELMVLKGNNEKNMSTGLIELLMSMSVALGLNKDITYHNLSEFYIPVGLTERKAKNEQELKYYESGAKFFQDYKP